VAAKTFVVTTLLLALGAPAALAQPGGAPPPPPPPGYGPPPPYGPPPAPPPGIQRQGFIVGFSIGGGAMMVNCDGCDSQSGVAFDLHLGGMINPTLAIVWDGSGVAHTESNFTLVNAINTVALQYWATPQLWVKGGVGIGRLSVSDENGQTIAQSDTAGAAMGAVGFEVMQGQSFALDLSLRVVPVFYDGDTVTNTALNIGFNWY